MLIRPHSPKETQKLIFKLNFPNSYQVSQTKSRAYSLTVQRVILYLTSPPRQSIIRCPAPWSKHKLVPVTRGSNNCLCIFGLDFQLWIADIIVVLMQHQIKFFCFQKMDTVILNVKRKHYCCPASNVELMNVCGHWVWTIQKVTVVVCTLLKNSEVQWSPGSTDVFSAVTELVDVGLRFHRGHSSLGISLYPRQECVPLSVGPPAEQSLRSVALAGPRLALYGCVGGSLALQSARGSSPDGRWNSRGYGAENPIKKQFQAPALRRWSAPVHQGVQAKPFCTSITPKTKSLHAPLSYLPLCFYSSISCFYRKRLQTQQNMECGPRGSVALAC